MDLNHMSKLEKVPETEVLEIVTKEPSYKSNLLKVKNFEKIEEIPTYKKPLKRTSDQKTSFKKRKISYQKIEEQPDDLKHIQAKEFNNGGN